MYAHLTEGAELLPSQVVRPTPRGAQAYDAGNVAALLPPAKLNPAPGDRIRFQHNQLLIPE